MKERKMESFEAGQYSPTAAEIEAARARAKMKREDPDAAEAVLRKKMAGATGRLRDKQSEEAIDSAERSLGK